jgi:predicted acetyltransferase
MGTYRPVREEHEQSLKRLLQYSFVPERGNAPESYRLTWPPDLFDLRGVFENGELRSACKRYRFESSVRGHRRSIGGIGALTTSPGLRRQGYARELSRHVLDEFREEGVDLVALWPSDIDYHRKHGWGIAQKFRRYEFPPEQLRVADSPEGRFDPVTGDDWERLRTVEESARRTLSIRRSESWWRQRTLGDWGGSGTPFAFGYERDGSLRGFVVYTIERDEGSTPHEASRRLRVRQLSAADDEAHRALLQFLGDHDSQVDTVELRRPEGSRLLDRVREPETGTCTVEAGPMVRLTAVDALERFPWPESLDAEFTLRVSDPLVDGNDGEFTVTVTDGAASVEPDSTGDLPAGSSGGTDPDLVTDIATLSQMYVGTYDLATAERLGDCRFDRSVADQFSEVFTETEVALRAFF